MRLFSNRPVNVCRDTAGRRSNFVVSSDQLPSLDLCTASMAELAELVLEIQSESLRGHGPLKYLASLFDRNVSADVGFAMPVARTHDAQDRSGLSWLK